MLNGISYLKAVIYLIYNINDSYYINQALDSWLTGEDDLCSTTEDEDVNFSEERGISDD